MLQQAAKILEDNRRKVLALAHALETHKTLTGEDVVAVLEGRPGPLVDGSAYADDSFIAELETYHRAALSAHRNHAKLTMAMPSRPGALVLDLTATVPDDTEVWRRPEPLNAPTGNGASPPAGPAQP